MPVFRIPVATYRIQFSLGFRFVDGRDLVPYLNELGITDLYSSPRFMARRGSPHAYDVANPLKINSELGTEEEYRELAQKLQNYQMGLILDLVPNHMATSPENPWWMDVLENGRASIYVSHFAIDWDRGCIKSTGKDQVVLPILGDLYGKVLENREFTLKLDENGFFLRYYEKRLPLDPRTYPMLLAACRGVPDSGELAQVVRGFETLPAPVNDPEQAQRRHDAKEDLKRRLWQFYTGNPEFKAALDECLISAAGVKGDPRSFDLLDRILARQPYRLAYWRMAGEELNYRRFFDINDLIGVRVEDAEVFRTRHLEILDLVSGGLCTGLRVDHIDGLWDPGGYLERLQTQIGGGRESFYIIVEKILAGDEDLPEGWQTSGTTGYDFLNHLNGIFVDPEGLGRLGDTYRRFTGIVEDFAEVRYRRKKQVMQELFAGEVRALGFHFSRIAAQDRFARDLPFDGMVAALVEVTACLPVYRTYTHDFSVSERDRQTVERAIEAASRRIAIDPDVVAFLRRVLLSDIPPYIERREEWLGFLMDWQQFTGPVMAKGFEDTSCYYYNRLISENEVGSDPELADHPVDIEGFHQRNRRRLERWPHTLNATSTHDTKRSEDVRARINVLSEIPELWGRRLYKWSKWNEPNKQQVDGSPAPDRNDETLLYQTLVGAWPACPSEMDSFRDRIRNYMQKAIREAKTHSSWLRPNEPYENACLAFINAILAEGDDNRFLKDFTAFHKRIAVAGALNALSQVLLKIASPGVPDFYQGTELWDFSLVDPDNRRPVDFKSRSLLLDDLKRREAQDLPALLRELDARWADGRIKLYLTYKALNFRRANAPLFDRGAYVPVAAGDRVCSFARRSESKWALVCAPRLTASVKTARNRLVALKQQWEGADVELPAEAPERWRNVLTGANLAAQRRRIPLADVFAAFPVALLETE